jgi:DNA-binding MarR family transcriptional regulator
MPKDADQVDQLIAQWRRERPDLDPRAMATVGRLLRVAGRFGAEIDRYLADHGVQRGDADVLATLRRAGPPHRLSPGRLAESLLITSGGMTARLDRLERAGLVARRPNPEDRRSIDVELTARGRNLVDQVLPGHVANEERLLSPLNDRERETLDRLMRKLLEPLEGS